jgi:hypothetical protein
MNTYILMELDTGVVIQTSNTPFTTIPSHSVQVESNAIHVGVELEYHVVILGVGSDNQVLSFSSVRIAPPVRIVQDRMTKIEGYLKSADQKYKELDLTTATLEEVKQAKITQLDEACGYTIVSGFDHDINGVSYHFSCSLAAQANFTGAKVRFMAGETTAEEWTAVDNTTGEEVRLMLDELTFKPIADKVYQLIDTSVKKLRNTLQPQVKAATTNAEVDAIVW